MGLVSDLSTATATEGMIEANARTLFTEYRNNHAIWTPVSDKHGISLSKATNGDRIITRTECILPCTATHALQYFLTPANRTVWDANCHKYEFIREGNSPKAQYYYYLGHGKWPAAPRDTYLLQVTEEEPDGTLIHFSTSVPDCPEVPKVVRMTANLNGFVFKPIDDASCHFTQYNDWDLNGSLPSFITSVVVCKDTPGNVEKFRQCLAQSTLPHHQ